MLTVITEDGNQYTPEYGVVFTAIEPNEGTPQSAMVHLAPTGAKDDLGWTEDSAKPNPGDAVVSYQVGDHVVTLTAATAKAEASQYERAVIEAAVKYLSELAASGYGN